MNWFVSALLSAFFAGLTALLAKIGIKDISSNLATAIRTLVVLIITWGIVVVSGDYKGLSNVPKLSLLFLILSGAATGLSWLFYFKALQIGEMSKVAPVDKLSLVFALVFAVLILKEKVTIASLLGVFLITLGTVLIAWGK